MRAALGLLNSDTSYPSLLELVDRARVAGVSVTLSETGDAPMSPAVSRALFRVVQEALTNVTKHAPGAAVTVTVDRASPVRVSVVNGPGDLPSLGERRRRGPARPVRARPPRRRHPDHLIPRRRRLQRHRRPTAR